MDLNPPIIIEKFKVKTNFNVKVVRDDYLVGGTKQRSLSVFLDPNKAEYIYAGPAQGYAQVALAYLGSLNNKKTTVFLRSGKETKLTKKARSYGAKIIYVKPPNKLSDIQLNAQKYASKRKDRLLLPFGLGSTDFIEDLSINIKQAWGRKRKPKRMWIVAGSGTILKSLSLIFPQCMFLVVQVGKRIWPDQLEGFKSKLYTAEEKFWEDAKIPPPYESVSNYDAKLWSFVLKYGKNGDYIWNVGRN